MISCSKCGAENPVANKYCARCEMPLPNSGVGGTLTGGPNTPGGNASKGSPPQTLFGMAPGWPPPPAPDKANKDSGDKPALQQTLFGVAPGAAEQASASASPQPEANSPVGSPHAAEATLGSDTGISQRTLLGVMPEGLAKALDAARGTSRFVPPNTPTPSVASPPASHASSRAAGGAARFEPVRNAATMIGGAVSAPVPHHPAAESALAASPIAHAWADPKGRAEEGSLGLADTGEAQVAAELPHPGSGLAAPLHPGELLHARTQLGVAIPGIAPLRAGVSGSPPQPVAPPDKPLVVTTVEPQSASGAFAIPPRPQMPRSALVLLCSGLLLALSAVAFAVLWKGTKPLSAVVSADASGKDRIDVVCADCTDGTVIDVDGASAEVKERKAYLTLERALALGDNELTFGIKRPEVEGRQLVHLSLPPVEYRIRPDTSTLTGDPPRLTLKIEALPGSQIQISEKPVALDAEGHSEVAVDITGHLTGTASEVTTFEQSVAYAITPPSGKRYAGELRVKIGVTPLLLEAPGSDTVTDLARFMLAGRTTKVAELMVAGNSIAVDGGGRFAQLMSIDSVGETQVSVRASQPGLAPRFAVFRLERVKNLAAEVAVRRKSALALADVASNIPAHLGKTVLVTGKVEEVRVDGHRTLLIVQADGECAGRSCLARLVYGGLRKLERGAKLTAIGRLQGAVGAAGNQDVPEIEVALLL